MSVETKVQGKQIRASSNYALLAKKSFTVSQHPSKKEKHSDLLQYFCNFITPFLSLLVFLFQNESLFKTFPMKISLICVEMNL